MIESFEIRNIFDDACSISEETHVKQVGLASLVGCG